jgi:hypothetical protein
MLCLTSGITRRAFNVATGKFSTKAKLIPRPVE